MTDYTERLTLAEARDRIGDPVTYHTGIPGHPPEDGVITGTSSGYVFVRFGHEGTGAKACRAVDLQLVTP